VPVADEVRQQLLDRVRRPPLPLAQFHQRGVDDDPVQPRVELRPRLEAVNRLERAHERVLHGVLRVGVVSEQPAGHREQPAAIGADDELERRVVAALQARDEVGIGLWVVWRGHRDGATESRPLHHDGFQSSGK
jgi:hypothetical protein